LASEAEDGIFSFSTPKRNCCFVIEPIAQSKQPFVSL